MCENRTPCISSHQECDLTRILLFLTTWGIQVPKTKLGPLRLLRPQVPGFKLLVTESPNLNVGVVQKRSVLYKLVCIIYLVTSYILSTIIFIYVIERRIHWIYKGKIQSLTRLVMFYFHFYCIIVFDNDSINNYEFRSSRKVILEVIFRFNFMIFKIY